MTFVKAADRLVAQLREELLTGRYEPGQRLREEEIAARFRTGRYTVRSALHTLVAAGLLDHQANKGAFVPLLTHERVDELWEYRQILEVGALRLALRDGLDLSAITAATVDFQEISDHAPWVDVIVAHQRIHHEFVAAAQNAKLLHDYQRCEEELHYVVSTVQPTITTAHLKSLHAGLIDDLNTGGNVAIEALERDLEIGHSSVIEALSATTLWKKDYVDVHYDPYQPHL